MSDLTEFLLARIAEDERVAHRAGAGAWTISGAGADRWFDGLGISVLDSTWDACIPTNEAEHAALHDPARVLAECEAKRRILALHRREEFGDDPGISFCAHDQRTSGLWPCATIRLLALPYADLPDYRAEWRP